MRRLLATHGTTNWSLIAKFVPGRSGKSCKSFYLSLANSVRPRFLPPHLKFDLNHLPRLAGRLRFFNQLRSDLRRDPFSPEEDACIIEVGGDVHVVINS